MATRCTSLMTGELLPIITPSNLTFAATNGTFNILPEGCSANTDFVGLNVELQVDLTLSQPAMFDISVTYRYGNSGMARTLSVTGLNFPAGTSTAILIDFDRVYEQKTSYTVSESDISITNIQAK